MVVVIGCVGAQHALADEIVRALRELDIEVELGDGVGAEHALAIVGDVSIDSAARVRELAAGCGRLLAITASEVDLRQGLTLLEAGACDVIPWSAGASAIAGRLARWVAIDELVTSAVVRGNLVGRGRAWRRVLERVVELARFTMSSLLLAGESGTGKELVARLVHTLDARPDKRELVTVDCTTIVPTLSGSELFGHERGAYTGATLPRDGAFALADGGTLFLDEVGELPLPLQAQLLRVVQERAYKRVGGNEWVRTDFRLICASHRDLAAAVRRGTFRHDLYHRIATWTVQLPSLADRREDIPLLARHFINNDAVQLDRAVEDYLVQRAYPGNVRELRHVVQRLLDRRPLDGPITLGQIPEDERAAVLDAAPAWPDNAFENAIHGAVASNVGLKGLRKTTEDLAVRIALALESGSVAGAARRLGVTERALQLRQAAWRSGDDGN
ncbi:MAG: sigma 54-interacting transcriptional regulator [Myxococcota bacterium]|nr:sigma 54-interacting transcriptional regulator [Myxococcota bacterium]